MATLTDIDLDAGIRRWIARLEELAPTLPDLTSTDPAVQRLAARQLSDLLAVDFTLPAPEGVEITDVTLGGRHARRYTPATTSTALPTQLWLHGGGFYAGTPDEILNDRLCARRALESGVQIFSLDYRLAPEHPYPAPVQDAMAALAELVTDADRWLVDPARLGIGGNSAGAAIAASTALHVRDAGSPHLIHVDLEVPPMALHPVGQSAIDFAVGFGLDQMELIAAIYTGPEGPADDYISPLDAPDVSGLPPHLILVAEYDPLRDGGVDYAERLREAGVAIELFRGAGQLHGSPGQTSASPGAAEWQHQHAHLLALAYKK